MKWIVSIVAVTLLVLTSQANAEPTQDTSADAEVSCCCNCVCPVQKTLRFVKTMVHTVKCPVVATIERIKERKPVRTNLKRIARLVRPCCCEVIVEAVVEPTEECAPVVWTPVREILRKVRRVVRKRCCDCEPTEQASSKVPTNAKKPIKA